MSDTVDTAAKARRVCVLVIGIGKFEIAARLVGMGDAVVLGDAFSPISVQLEKLLNSQRIHAQVADKNWNVRATDVDTGMGDLSFNTLMMQLTEKGTSGVGEEFDKAESMPPAQMRNSMIRQLPLHRSIFDLNQAAIEDTSISDTIKGHFNSIYTAKKQLVDEHTDFLCETFGVQPSQFPGLHDLLQKLQKYATTERKSFTEYADIAVSLFAKYDPQDTYGTLETAFNSKNGGYSTLLVT